MVPPFFSISFASHLGPILFFEGLARLICGLSLVPSRARSTLRSFDAERLFLKAQFLPWLQQS